MLQLNCAGNWPCSDATRNLTRCGFELASSVFWSLRNAGSYRSPDLAVPWPLQRCRARPAPTIGRNGPARRATASRRETGPHRANSRRPDPRFAGARQSAPAIPVRPSSANRLYVMDRPGVAPPAAGTGSAHNQRRDSRQLSGFWASIRNRQNALVARVRLPVSGQLSGRPARTPTCRTARVYTLGAMGDLRLPRCRNGKAALVARVPQGLRLVEARRPGAGQFAAGGGDRVYSLVGGDGSAVVCFDAGTARKSGGLSPHKKSATHRPSRRHRRPEATDRVRHPEEAAGLDPATGKVIWSLRIRSRATSRRPEVNIAAPRVIGDRLLASSFYHGAMLLKLPSRRRQARRSLEQAEPESDAAGAGLHTVMCTPMLRDGYIYGICGHGELRCLSSTPESALPGNARGGQPQARSVRQRVCGRAGRSLLDLQRPGRFDSRPAHAAGLRRARPAAFARHHARNRGRQVTWCHPAFANKCAYVRNDKEMVCVSLAKG